MTNNPTTQREADERAKLIERLRTCASDPMWADHAEVSKALLNAAADALTRQAATEAPASADGALINEGTIAATTASASWEVLPLGYVTQGALDQIADMGTDFSTFRNIMVRNTPGRDAVLPIYGRAPAPSRETALLDAITRLERQDSTYEERIAAADGLRAALARAPLPAPDAPLSNAEFLAKRLGRVAKLAGVTMPSGTYEQIAEVAGTILGDIARVLESKGVQAVDVARDAARYRFIEEHATMHGGGNGFTITCFVGVDEEDMGIGIDRMLESRTNTTGGSEE